MKLAHFRMFWMVQNPCREKNKKNNPQKIRFFTLKTNRFVLFGPKKEPKKICLKHKIFGKQRAICRKANNNLNKWLFCSLFWWFVIFFFVRFILSVVFLCSSFLVEWDECILYSICLWTEFLHLLLFFRLYFFKIALLILKF